MLFHHTDLYVLRRAVGVYQQIVNRFTAQTTDYQELLSVFAEGLFTEMDFRCVNGFSCSAQQIQAQMLKDMVFVLGLVSFNESLCLMPSRHSITPVSMQERGPQRSAHARAAR